MGDIFDRTGNAAGLAGRIGGDHQLGERRPGHGVGLGARLEVGDGTLEHDLVVGGIGQRPRPIHVGQCAEIRPLVVEHALLGVVEAAEAVDEDRLDQTVLVAEPRVHAGRRAPGGRGHGADRERPGTVEVEDLDRRTEDRLTAVTSIGS